MKCNHPKDSQSVTKDGALGLRSHCLKCGFVKPVKEVETKKGKSANGIRKGLNNG